jgi:hypothetical protein
MHQREVANYLRPDLLATEWRQIAKAGTQGGLRSIKRGLDNRNSGASPD